MFTARAKRTFIDSLSSVVFCCVVVLAEPASAQAETTLTFAVVPQQAAGKLARLWVPILEYINSETGYQLRFATAPNIPTFEERLAAGQYDIAYMNPYHYTVFHMDPGYVAYAKQKNKRIRGIVVVRKDSTITGIEALNGRTLAFPAPAAFAASLLPRASFRQNNLHVTPVYVASHDSVYRNVAKGLYPAGGGIERTLKNVTPSIRKDLRVLWTTAPYTPHAFAAHPRVPADVVATITETMTHMHLDARGKELLDAIEFQGIERAQDTDWDDVRALKIQPQNH